ncbi:hypothetical protein WMF45_07270 [Sorangium sp. So ce448]
MFRIQIIDNRNLVESLAAAVQARATGILNVAWPGEAQAMGGLLARKP